MIGYNLISVLLGAGSIGVAAGIAGTFMVLRKRVLLSDAAAHATLPGLALAFLIALSLGINDGRSLPILLCGAILSGALGTALVQLIKTHTRLHEDAAMSLVLSSFYGLGVVLLSYIQQLNNAGKSGLEGLLLGQVAGILLSEAWVLFGVSIVVVCVTLFCLKPLTALCFDEAYAGSAGLPIQKLDYLLYGLMLLIVCAGLKVLGIILVLALLIIPAATAKLWSAHVWQMMLISALAGLLSAIIGSILSSYIVDLPTGPAIVLVAFSFFLLSALVKSLFLMARGGRRDILAN